MQVYVYNRIYFINITLIFLLVWRYCSSTCSSTLFEYPVNHEV